MLVSRSHGDTLSRGAVVLVGDAFGKIQSLR